MQVAATKLTVNNNILLELFETEVLQLELTLSHSVTLNFQRLTSKRMSEGNLLMEMTL